MRTTPALNHWSLAILYDTNKFNRFDQRNSYEQNKLYFALLTLARPFFSYICANNFLSSGEWQEKVVINNISFQVSSNFRLFTRANLSNDVPYSREPLITFTNIDTTITTMKDLTYQAAYLADQKEGYLASITSPEENTFLFEQINWNKYF